MASARVVWGIDIGQCALKAIKLKYEPKTASVTAEAFDYIEHPKILSQPDADSDALIRSALEAFLSRNNVDDIPIIVGVVNVPGQPPLSRFVTLPPVESKKIPDIVKFEARQQIPYPLEEVVWDYQTIGSGMEEAGFALETEVGIFAMKRDAAYRLLDPLQSMGMEVEAIQMGAVALHNYATYDYFGGGDPEVERDFVVLLDMGADKTDVVATNGSTIWVRNFPTGGSHFTRALSKDLDLSFAKAEHLKRNATKAPDPKKLYQAMRPVFQDLASEVQRSIDYFLSSHKGASVTKVLAVGAGFKLPGLQKFLQQNLEYDVEKVASFDKVVGPDVLDSASFKDNLPGFAVAYGLALQGLVLGPLKTNLLPKEIQVERIVRAKKPWALAAATAFLVGFAAIYAGNWNVYNQVNAKEWDAPVKEATQKANIFTNWASGYQQSLTTFNGTKENAQVVLNLDDLPARLDWIEIFPLISKFLPPRDQAAGDVVKSNEVNVEFIDAVYLQDVGLWFQSLDENHRTSLPPNQRDAPPEGEGWVFQVMGYTFNGGDEVFLRDQIIKRFQSEEALKAGVTHALIARSEINTQWQPANGSPLAEWPRMVQSLAQAAQQAGEGEMNPVDYLGDVNNVNNDNQQRKKSSGTQGYTDRWFPEDFMQYFNESFEAFRRQPQVYVKRTDFAIQFVWQPRKAGQLGQQPAAGDEGDANSEEEQY